MNARLLLLACLLVSCRDASSPGRVDLGVPAPMPVEKPVVPAPAVAASAQLLRVIERQGEQGGTSVPGVGQCFFTGAQGNVVLDLPNGARLHIEPGSDVCVLEFEPSAVLLIAGSAFAELLPSGNQAGRSALRLITAPGSLVVPSTAEVWLAQRNGRNPFASQTYLRILRGFGEFAHFDAAGKLQADALAAGQAVPSAATLQPGAAATLDQVRQAGAAFLRKPGNTVRLAEADSRLERAIERAAEEQRLGAELTARIAPTPPPAAVAAPGTVAEVRAYQRELASHAQRKYELRQALLLAAEQSLLAVLASCPSNREPALVCPALAAWQGRFSAQLQHAF